MPTILRRAARWAALTLASAALTGCRAGSPEPTPTAYAAAPPIGTPTAVPLVIISGKGPITLPPSLQQPPQAAPASSPVAAAPSLAATWQGPRVLVYLDGLGSRAGCADSGGAPNANLNAIAGAVKATATAGIQTIAYSYGGAWQDCATGATFDATSYPVRSVQTAMPVPAYEATNTCGGIAAAAKGLGALVSSILTRQPDAGIVLAGHSLGGMVADYYAATVTAATAAHLLAVISIDSPLLGADVSGFSPDLLSSYRGPCPLDSPSWLDIQGKSAVAGEIAKLGTSSLAGRVFAVNATVIGQAVPGTRYWVATCAPYGGLFGIGHSCPLMDAAALAHVAAIVAGEALLDFQLQGAVTAAPAKQ